MKFNQSIYFKFLWMQTWRNVTVLWIVLKLNANSNYCVLSGMVPALFPDDEKESVLNQLRDEAMKNGSGPSKESVWQYFVNKSANNLHIVLAMSPVGDTLRTRCRNFPGVWTMYQKLGLLLLSEFYMFFVFFTCVCFCASGLVNNTSIDWFSPWPPQALHAVAKSFLGLSWLENLMQFINIIIIFHQPTTMQFIYASLSIASHSRWESNDPRVSFRGSDCSRVHGAQLCRRV